MSANPFVVDGETCDDIRHTLAALYRLGLMSVVVDPGMTVNHMGATMIAYVQTVDPGDNVAGFHGILYELADMISAVFDDREPTIEFPECGNPECEDNHATSATFMEAAIRKDFTSCQGVVRAEMREAVRLERPPFVQALKFFVDTFMLFLTESHNHVPPIDR